MSFNQRVLGASLAVSLSIGFGFGIVPGIIPDSASIVLASEARVVGDSNGDYYIVGNDGDVFLPWEWQVVDRDPNGLNCRYKDRLSNTGDDFYNFPVAYTLPTGTIFEGTAILPDDRGLPWIWVGSSNTREICFVRANSRFVRPVGRPRR